tara:strand:- start:304 stop:462 length:159 start_codon:yes stop_codon:yes gene_type:complete
MKKTQKNDGSRKESICDEKERKTQAIVNGNKKGKNYDILPEEFEDIDMVWFW